MNTHSGFFAPSHLLAAALIAAISLAAPKARALTVNGTTITTSTSKTYDVGCRFNSSSGYLYFQKAGTYTLKGSFSYPILVSDGDGSTFIFDGVTISTSSTERNPFQVGTKSCTIQLKGANSLKSTGSGMAALQISSNGSVVIQSPEEGIGATLTCSGGSYGAGIGGDKNGSCGTVQIYGGRITATGGSYAAEDESPLPLRTSEVE